MQKTMPLVFAVALALFGSADARDKQSVPRKEGTPVAIVGQVTSAPHKVLGAVERRFQIALGPGKHETYTLHINDAVMTGMNGNKIAASDLDDKQWVRAEGTIMNDPRRIKVAKLEVIGKDSVSVKKSKFFRTQFERGYIEDLNASGSQ